MKMIKVNAIGDACPIPVVKTKKAISAMTSPELVEVLVDNEIAVQNVTKLAKELGAQVVSSKIKEGEYRISIQTEGAASVEEEGGSVAQRGDKTVVVFASDRMGEGNDELGKVLVKGFIFALTQLDKLPETLLFYNGGATLTAEGSDCLEDLLNLSKQGVQIFTCGTCLNYYNLTDHLKVGEVTNMYHIVETMAKADKILRP